VIAEAEIGVDAVARSSTAYALLIACPSCGAAIGERCKHTRSGRPVSPHLARRIAAREIGLDTVVQVDGAVQTEATTLSIDGAVQTEAPEVNRLLTVNQPPEQGDNNEE